MSVHSVVRPHIEVPAGEGNRILSYVCCACCFAGGRTRMISFPAVHLLPLHIPLVALQPIAEATVALRHSSFLLQVVLRSTTVI